PDLRHRGCGSQRGLCRAGRVRALQPRDRADRDALREAVVQLLGALSLRAVRGAGGRPVVRMKLEDEIVRRQRERARIMAWLLGGFVVLLFFITIAKTGINW